jgi:hypothetical protein
MFSLFTLFACRYYYTYIRYKKWAKLHKDPRRKQMFLSVGVRVRVRVYITYCPVMKCEVARLAHNCCLSPPPPPPLQPTPASCVPFGKHTWREGGRGLEAGQDLYTKSWVNMGGLTNQNRSQLGNAPLSLYLP